MIKVNKKLVEYSKGMTVSDALKLADEAVGSMIIVMVDRRVVSNSDLNITKINNNTQISTFRLVSGG